MRHYPETIKAMRGSEAAHARLQEAYISVRRAFRDRCFGKNEPNLQELTEEMEARGWRDADRAFKAAAWKAVNAMEKSKQYSLLPDLFKAVCDLSNQLRDTDDEHVIVFSSVFSKAVHLLMGSETSFLVGARDNKLVYQAVDPDISILGEVERLMRTIHLDVSLEYIDAAAARILPDPWNWVDVMGWSFPSTSPDEVHEAMIEAYANQHFTLSSAGALVEFSDKPWGVSSLRFLAKRSLHSPNRIGCVDLMGTFTFENGRQFFMVVDPDRLEDGLISEAHFFLAYILACAYRDLVVVKHRLSGDRKIAVTCGSDMFRCSVDAADAEQGVRDKMKTPRKVSSHARRGHPDKRGPLSDEHKVELVEAEKKYGIKIFGTFDPDVETYVVPCTVPRMFSKEFDELPHFVRKRLLDDMVGKSR